MPLHEKLLAKLQPHADRIAQGENNDFDYLPAVLLQTLSGQQQTQEQQATSAKKIEVLNESLISTADASNRTISAVGESLKNSLNDIVSAQQQTQEQQETSAKKIEVLNESLISTADASNKNVLLISKSLQISINGIKSAQQQAQEQQKTSAKKIEALNESLISTANASNRNIGAVAENLKILLNDIKSVQRQTQEQQKAINVIVSEFYAASRKQNSRVTGLLVASLLFAVIAAGASLFLLLSLLR